MSRKAAYDAVVVGAGPNGLAAAITLAQAGRSVIVFEAKETVGGGMRSAELTLPGFVHDICSAIHPLGLSSPFFRELALEQHGLTWIHPEIPLAHPFEDGSAAALHRSVEATGNSLEKDAEAYSRLMDMLVDDWQEIIDGILGPIRLPRHPMALVGFGLLAIRSAEGLAKKAFEGKKARGFFSGLAGHSMIELDKAGTAAFGLVLALLGHAVGWPLPRGGTQKLANALTYHLQTLGGEIVTGRFIHSLDELPSTRAILCDVTPRQLLAMAGDRLPSGYRHKLEGYRYGPGVFKIDWALDGPIPWRAEACRQAGTVHVGGTLEAIAAAEKAVWQGKYPEKPYVLVAQQSLFDDSRAPNGQQTAWAYCHVPNNSNVDMTEAITAQIERFAPGFRDIILAKHTFTAIGMEEYNPNYVGGDINGGVQDLRQLYTRPVARLIPYSTPVKDLFLCSSSTPPGGGVHGMCGYHAAQAVLNAIF
ncbi:MAG: FAD-dependent oxidoreductase [Anaerolineae bacterium SG8_19]|jgi:phytoene dehydrogenase-like protein|nr:MAG: FAD-dependent oxidoreductase [Anaerolineae bacterium SG8_19]